MLRFARLILFDFSSKIWNVAHLFFIGYNKIRYRRDIMEENCVKGKIAFISGASSGIGKATAEKLAQMGVNLILCARRENILNELKENLEKQYGVKVKNLVFDVRNYNDVLKNINSLDDEWKKIDILVNNAGLAVGLEKIYQYDMEDVDRMVDTNIKGFTYIANTILPLMIATDKVCTVVNIGSVAGEIAYPNGSIYCATKFAVKAISDAMRSELIDKKIKVTNIKPGLVDTEFSLIRFKGDKTKADNVYKGIEPLYAEDIADTIAYVVNLPEKIQITDLTVTPLHQANAIHIYKEK
ncbi:short-chain alcohol dehydrogenase [Fusobacterium polymorphum ATCC 10953]|uniref:Short-chain alcohol dehydrogenase n=2 Tax=Fusobacterium nucleatum subsp. polymorphum TaxID=76857 RepID=A5TX02_FUSNP|nr:short-chain alcohol dehydrogenase [Fusobacterium polymorphum ATCC 10953]